MPYPSAVANEELDLVVFSKLLWFHRYLLAVMTVLFTAAAVIFALTQTPIFRGEAVVTSVTRDPSMAGGASGLGSQLGGIASIVGLNIGSSGNAKDQDMALLKSRHLAEEFINKYGLIPLLFPKPTDPHTLWRAVDRFKKTVLTVNEDKKANTTTVSIKWTDPATAAKWANAYVSLANEIIRDRSVEESKRNVAFLNAEISRTSVVGVQGALFGLIESETKNLMIASSRSEYAFSLVDPAVPPEVRFSPQRTMIVTIGAALGLFLGITIVFIIRSVEQNRRRGQLPQG